MTDEYDGIIDALDQEPSEAPARKAASAKASAKSEASSAGRNAPRGKRADPSREQVNASVRKSVKSSAVAYLANEEKDRPEKAYKMQIEPLEEGYAPRSLSDLIEQLLTSWVEHRGGNIFEKK